ncbi:DUF2877 domain-containing protein [Lacrimispora sp.]|jgi:hypothetical protein|uniref:DUF2877 domain-containing protein n=1 Tax=Lacrimispora sp. TaxID=2719234 RepID=UPI0028A67876|nr:DUF2877 domain-containing protein [Lacrimispora sp.]
MQKNWDIKGKDMRSLSGKLAASELIEALKEGEAYRIHSQFESGCNLALSPFLCFIGNKNDSLVPYGILLNKEDLPVFLEQAASSGCFQWDEKEKTLYSDSIRLCLKNTRIYSSYIQKKEYSIDREGLSMFERLIDWNLPTGFGESIGSFLMAEKKEVEELYQAFSKPKEEAEKTIKRWIGRGRGLTPSGDDFLMGLLYMDRICPMLEMPFLQGLKALIDRQYTTDISGHYYHCALEGYFNIVLAELLDAMILKDSSHMKMCIGRIRMIGSTSGCDMMLGMAAGANFIKGMVKNRMGGP